MGKQEVIEKSDFSTVANEDLIWRLAFIYMTNRGLSLTGAIEKAMDEIRSAAEGWEVKGESRPRQIGDTVARWTETTFMVIRLSEGHIESRTETRKEPVSS